MVIFEKNLEKHIVMRVILRADKRYTVQFIGGHSTFSFTTDQIEAVADRLAGLDSSFAMEQQAKLHD